MSKFITIDEVASRLSVSVEDAKSLIDQKNINTFIQDGVVHCKAADIEGLDGDIPMAEPGTGVGGGKTDFDLEFGGGSQADATFYMTPDSGTFDITGASSIETDAGDLLEFDGGQSVFEDDEVVEADNNAQTRITTNDSDTFSSDDDEDEDLVLEAVGSGSGLLDLTRESDDTSLGAELLEEIYPSSATGAVNSDVSQTGFGVAANSNASQTGFGVAANQSMSMASMFDTGTGQSQGADPSFVGDSAAVTQASMVGVELDAGPQVVYQREPIDYPGSGLALGLLLPVFGALLLAMVIVGFMLLGHDSPLYTDLAKAMLLNGSTEGVNAYVGPGIFMAFWLLPAFLFGGFFWFMGRRLTR